MQKDTRIETGWAGRVVLSELQVLKGRYDAGELEIEDFHYGRYCECNLMLITQPLEKLVGVPIVVFLNDRKNKIELSDFITCTQPNDCNGILQRVKEMVALQANVNWKESEEETKWFLRCMESDVLIELVYLQLFDANKLGYVIKDFKNLFSDEMKKDLEAKLYAQPKVNCREAYRALLVANWDDKRVLAPALEFLRNQKENIYEGCDDGFFRVNPRFDLLPNLMRMIAGKMDIPEAAKFATMFEDRNKNEVISEFLSFIENENKKRQQRKIIYAIASFAGVIGLALVLYKLRKRNLAFATKL